MPYSIRNQVRLPPDKYSIESLQASLAIPVLMVERWGLASLARIHSIILEGPRSVKGLGYGQTTEFARPPVSANSLPGEIDRRHDSAAIGTWGRFWSL